MPSQSFQTKMWSAKFSTDSHYNTTAQSCDIWKPWACRSLGVEEHQQFYLVSHSECTDQCRSTSVSTHWIRTPAGFHSNRLPGSIMLHLITRYEVKCIDPAAVYKYAHSEGQVWGWDNELCVPFLQANIKLINSQRAHGYLQSLNSIECDCL